MKKRFLTGALCLAMTASLFGCGKKETENTQAPSSQDPVTTEEIISSSSDQERAQKHMLFTIDYSEEAVLEAPEHAYLYADKLTLPIGYEDLLDYQTSSHEHVNGDEGPLKTYSIADFLEEEGEYEISYETLTNLYDKSYTSLEDEGGVYMPSLYIGKDDVTMTQNELMKQGIWYLDSRLDFPDTLGVDEDTVKTEMDMYSIESKEEYFLKKLINRFGNPNFLNITSSDHTVEEEMDSLIHPTGNDGTFAISFIKFGWIFEEFSLIVFTSDITNVHSEGEYTAYMNEPSLFYIPSGYGDFSEKYGENQLTEFLQKRQEMFGELPLYERQEEKFEAVAGTETEETTASQSDAESENIPELDFSEEANACYVYVDDCFQIGDHFNLNGEVKKGELHLDDEVYLQFSDGRVVSGKIIWLQQYREPIDVVKEGEQAGIEVSGVTRDDSDFLRPSVIIRTN